MSAAGAPRGAAKRVAGTPAVAAMLAAVLAVPLVAAADEPRNLRFGRYSLEDGLTQTFVTSIAQDREGFLWLGTQEGLNRFDGYEFIPFTHDAEDPESLSHDLIKAVTVDSAGVIWVGTDGGGLNRLGPGERRFTRFVHDPADPRSLSFDRVRVVLEDHGGRMWVGTDGGGLNRLDEASGTFTRWSHDPQDPASLGDDRVRSLAEDGSGRLWVATEGGGLSRLDPDAAGFVHFRHDPADPGSLPDDRVRVVFVSRDGTLWVGTYDRGLARLPAAGGRFETFRHDPADPASLPADEVRAIFEDREGALWIGTDLGLAEWRPESRTFHSYGHDPADPLSLSHDRILSIFQDRGGVLWVGTFAGLSKTTSLVSTFPHVRRGSGGEGQLANNYVTAFAEAPDGAIWVGSHGGLDRFDPRDQSLTGFRSDPDDPASLGDHRVMSLLVDRSETLWVGSIGGGLDRFDPATRGFTHFRHDPSDPRSLGGNGVSALLEDRSGRFWVGSYGGGLHLMDRGRGTFRRFQSDPSDPGSLSSDRVLVLSEDAAGTLWVGTDGGGLNRFDPATDTFEAIRHDPADPSSLSSDYVFSVLEDEDGDLWVGTHGAGLNRWRAEDRAAGRVRFQRVTKKTGLLSETINALLLDAEGGLWISTNRGLSRLDRETGRMRHFNASHGLQSDEFNFAAALEASDGRMYFGGIGGFNAFHPERVRINDHAPPIVLTRLLKFNRPFDPGVPLGELEQIELDHRDQMIAFEFAALDFAAPERNRYQHWLEGFDRGWVDIGNLRRATYTNLEPGTYTFHVRGANNDGVWSTRSLSLGIRAKPPPWQTGWAYGVYFLLFAGALSVFLRGQAQKRRRADELARVNRSLTAAIEVRRAAEERLRASERLFHALAENSPTGIFHSDAGGKTVYVNKAWCEITGLTAEEGLGDGWQRAIHPEDRGRRVETWRDTVSRKTSSGGGEFRVLRPDGSVVWVVGHAVPLPDEGGRVSGYVGTLTDITGIRQLREEKQIAERANRAKSLFLANMSHEIRTPMSSVLGSIDLLRESPLAEPQHRLVETARRAAGSLLGLLNDVLDVSKIEAGKLEIEAVAFDLPELVLEVHELFVERARRKGLKLAAGVDPALPGALCGDPVRLRQILSNLIGNALKFTEAGSVSVRVLGDGAEGHRTTVRFEVRDTGIGLEPEACERIFDVFQQADGSTTRRFGGSGLGLAISRQLVELMGGEIGVESAPGSGSTFWFTVPLTVPAAEQAPATGESPGGRYGAARDNLVPADARILVVEDNPDFRLTVVAMLERLGLSPEVAEDGREALAALSSGGYDLVLMDCQMPGMDGYETTLTFRRSEAEAAGGGRRTPVIAMTASALAGDRDRCFAAGMDGYLCKPFTLEGLAEFLGRWLSGNAEAPAPADAGPAAGGDPGQEGPGSTAALDAGALERIRHLGRDGSSDILERVARSFLETLPEALERLSAAVAAGDDPGMAAIAHRLKGSCDALGAVRAAALCADLERAGRSRDGSAAPRSLLERLRRELGRARQELETECLRLAS